MDKSVEIVIEILFNTFSNGNKLLIAGNGGAAADALHIVGELRKNFKINRKLNKNFINSIEELYPQYKQYYTDNLQNSLPVISLVSEISFITAWLNDADPDLIFAQQLIGLGNKNDVLLLISTSGNSLNMLHAARIAKCLGIITIALTGNTKNQLIKETDYVIQVPYTETDYIQEAYIKIYHYICEKLEKRLFS